MEFEIDQFRGSTCGNYIVSKTKAAQAGYGICLQEAADYLKSESDIENDLINGLISGSYDQICAECNRDFVQTDYSASIVNGSGVFLTSQDVNWVSTGSLEVRKDGSYVTFYDAVYNGPITYTVASGSEVPNNAKIFQKVWISNWYENRQMMAFGQSPMSLIDFASAMLSPYKLVRP